MKSVKPCSAIQAIKAIWRGLFIIWDISPNMKEIMSVLNLQFRKSLSDVPAVGQSAWHGGMYGWVGWFESPARKC